jgi:hypothetical protein
VLETVAAFLLGPSAAFNFLYKAVSKLYYANTKDEKLFSRKRSFKATKKRLAVETMSRTDKDAKKMDNLRQIKLGVGQRMKAFLTG